MSAPFICIYILAVTVHCCSSVILIILRIHKKIHLNTHVKCLKKKKTICHKCQQVYSCHLSGIATLVIWLSPAEGDWVLWPFWSDSVGERLDEEMSVGKLRLEGWVLWALWYTSSCFFLFVHVSVLSLHLKKWLGSMQMTWWFSFLQLFTWNTVCVGWIILDVPFVIAEFTAFCLPRSVRECSRLTQLSIWAQWSVWMHEHVHSVCFPLGSLYWCCALHWFLL